MEIRDSRNGEYRRRTIRVHDIDQRRARSGCQGRDGSNSQRLLPLAHDYLELESGSPAARISTLVPTDGEKGEANDLDARQQAAAERWSARQKETPEQGTTRTSTPAPRYPDLELKPQRNYDRGGPEDDF
jgi:hypothetical protein